MLDRLPRSRILVAGHLEQVKDVLGARGRPQRQEMVIRVGKGAATANRHEARIADLRQDHAWRSFCFQLPVGPRATTDSS
jgi:hypothetical protein